MEEHLAQLIPVSEWTFYLYRITYWKVERDVHQPHKVKYVVSTDTHVDDAAQDNWPSDWYTVYTADEICAVPRPRQIGQLYGHRIDESAIAAGEREARARGFTT